MPIYQARKTHILWLVKKLIVCIVMILLSGGAFCQGGGALILVEKGQSNYRIVVSKDAIEGISEAALELQRLIALSTGVKLAIQHKPNPDYQSIFVGESYYTEKAGISSDGLSLDEYFIKAKGRDLYLVGKDDSRQSFYALNLNQSASAGTFFSAIDFARQYLDAAWYMPGPLGEEITRHNKLEVPEAIDIKGGPKYGMRFIDVTNVKTREHENNLVKTSRLTESYFNASATEKANLWGRHLRLGRNFDLDVAHAWFKWLPAEAPNEFSKIAYGKSHPEFFSEPGGKWGRYYYGRTNNLGGQLCICNPETATAVAENIVEYAKRSGKRTFSLSPNDGKWSCSCDCCKKDKSRYRSNSAELTAEVLRFSNLVVEKVVKEIPDARFGLYAYSWMVVPPADVSARKEIYISDVYNGLPYRYYVDKEKSRVEKNLLDWREKVERIVLTSYYTFYGHYSLPWSDPSVTEWLFDLLTRSETSSGLRINYALRDPPPMGVLGADPWVMSELMWNPSQSVKALYDQYYIGAFGPEVGPVIKEYFSVISRSLGREISKHPYRDAGGVVAYILPAYVPIRKECRELIARAVKLTEGMPERYQWRVDRVARGWQLTELTLDMLLAVERGDFRAAEQIKKKRKEFLLDEDNIFALARASADFQELIKPMMK